MHSFESVEQMSPTELDGLGRRLDEHLETYGNRAFSEDALNRLPKGLGASMIELYQLRAASVEAEKVTLRVEE